MSAWSKSPHSQPDLKWLLHPVDPEGFLLDHWEKRPRVITRSNRDYYDSILTLQDVDNILSNSSLRSPDIRLARDGKSISVDVLKTNDLLSQPVMYDSLFDEYRNGATIILQFLHERWPPLSELCQALSFRFSAAFQANVYVTPKSSQGFAAHFDDHDVFILQVAGRKRWKVHDQPMIYLPTKQETRHSIAAATDDKSYQQFDLCEGDCAYIPRGWVHEATSLESGSIHVTVGALTLTWGHLIRRAVSEACSTDQYRRSLPPGFATNEEIKAEAATRLARYISRARAISGRREAH